LGPPFLHFCRGFVPEDLSGRSSAEGIATRRPSWHRASRTTRSSAIARRRRSSAATDPSTGSASRASTPAPARIHRGRAQLGLSLLLAPGRHVHPLRADEDIERFGLEGPGDRWRAVRDAIHAEVCAKGYDAGRNTFVQSYGGKELDASLLMMALVGFLPPSDRRIRGPSRPSSASWSAMASSRATRPRPASTACRPARAPSSRARSGSPIAWRSWAGATTPAAASSASSRYAPTSASWRRSTIPSRSAWSAISLRPSPTSPSSTRPGT